jgi:hypothetical protein
LPNAAWVSTRHEAGEASLWEDAFEGTYDWL